MPYKDPEVRRRYVHNYYVKHKAQAIISAKEWCKRNPEKVKIIAREYQRKHRRLYRMAARKSYYKNIERSREKSRRWQVYERSTPVGKLKNVYRKRVMKALKAQGVKRLAEYEDLLECSWPDFFAHISSMLVGDWSWDNYTKTWEVDHIIPCRAFDLTKKENQIFCFSHKNTQPLSPHSNKTKRWSTDRRIIANITNQSTQ